MNCEERMRGWRLAVMVCLVLVVAGFVYMPRAEAQASVLYFPASGHFLDDTYGFLGFWQRNNGERVLGFPIAEARLVDGLAQQYFERGRLEQAIDPANSLVSVRPGRVGAEYAEALWKTFAAPPKRKAGLGVREFETTGHTLRAPFLAFWEANGGEAIFGAPISEGLWEQTENGRRQVQYFERARIERDVEQIGTDQELIVSGLGRLLAQQRGVDTSRLANWGAAEYGPAAPQGASVVSLDQPTPAPVPPTPVVAAQPKPAQPKPASAFKPAPIAAPSKPRILSEGKAIVVNLSDQWLYAYKDGEQVFSAPVSTGRDGMETPTGTYAVYAKLKLQTMSGVLDGVPWEVPNVPNVMYINGGVALHGTYWHNRFGTGARLSHGCVNLPLKSAAWLYEWAPVGTPVKVMY